MTLLIVYTSVAALTFATSLFIPGRRLWWVLIIAALWPLMILGLIQAVAIVVAVHVLERCGVRFRA